MDVQGDTPNDTGDKAARGILELVNTYEKKITKILSANMTLHSDIVHTKHK
tara:strand:- start:2183 stop:2335 length:153 start_codon:yes stop_codon:yes gene_type:complete